MVIGTFKRYQFYLLVTDNSRMKGTEGVSFDMDNDGEGIGFANGNRI